MSLIKFLLTLSTFTTSVLEVYHNTLRVVVLIFLKELKYFVFDFEDYICQVCFGGQFAETIAAPNEPVKMSQHQLEKILSKL